MTERYKLSGALDSFRRRDLRRGQQMGRVQILRADPPRLLPPAASMTAGAELAQQWAQREQAKVPEGCLPVQVRLLPAVGRH
jgi:hypothetical protein